jgi:hypothetical protein
LEKQRFRSETNMKLFPIITFLFFVSCVQPNQTESSNITESETNKISNSQIPNFEILEKSVETNLSTALKNVHQNEFDLKIEEKDSARNQIVNSELHFGNFLTSNHKHLLMNRFYEDECHIDLFLFENDKFTNLISHVQTNYSYERNAIYDVNGDELNDLVIFWHPSASCCRSNIQSVYLARKNEQSFEMAIEFVNPTFSFREKIIRGVEYGQPEEIGLYKFKWCKNQVDTLEYIFHSRDKNGGFIKINYSNIKNQESDTTYLAKLPNEYKNINEIDWFLSGSPN